VRFRHCFQAELLTLQGLDAFFFFQSQSFGLLADAFFPPPIAGVLKAPPAGKFGRGLNDSFSKSSGDDSRRQKQPLLRQHFLKRLPEPHGHRSSLPSFSISSFSP
jgi:hypothetical protein